MTKPGDENSVKRRADQAAIDNRTMIDMDQLKLFITEQNNKLQDTINQKLRKTIEDNNKANIQSLETFLKDKLDIFAGKVDSKIEAVRNDCMSAVQLLTDDVKDKVMKFSDDIENRIDYLERQAKLCDIIIKNVPYRQDESMKNTVYDLCDAIGYKNTGAIKSAFRLSLNSNKSNPIVMKFYDTEDKRDFMHAYFQRKNLNLSDLGFQTKLRIIISDALTKKNNDIFKKAMQLKFDKIFWSVNTKNGWVYYRLEQKSRPIRITSISALNAFILTGGNQMNANVNATQQIVPLYNSGGTTQQLDQRAAVDDTMVEGERNSGG